MSKKIWAFLKALWELYEPFTSQNEGKMRLFGIQNEPFLTQEEAFSKKNNIFLETREGSWAVSNSRKASWEPISKFFWKEAYF